MKFCLFSVSYAGFWGQQQLSLTEFIAQAAQTGYDSVMLMGKRPHLSPLDVTPEQLESIKDALAEHQIQCAIIGGYTDFAGSSATEVPLLELQIQYVQQLSQIARELGAGTVRIFTAYDTPRMSPHALWGQVVSALQECCDRAAEYDVTLAVQNHHDVGVHSDALLELLHDIDRPNCKLGFDAWSPALRGENLYDAARKMAPHTAITTNADYIRLPRYSYQPELINYQKEEPDLVRAVKFGTGFIDYSAFFHGLKEGGFNGIATYEMCSPIRGGGSLENLNAYAAEYLTWMKTHLL
ncbi:sugar phosphate isomerase/epimerase family protein [Gimesia chilikensis]|uniref:Fructoselysine 3-epimerase n=1 Tax=Gimesia chilikensis TaxID=2605989 RepID=A0A517PS36_9PLAN|nr:sugar phosphate isomerase/epimerase family protein [Gimesia chilikensis]QDT22185.1 fructoselysine 3-epimerase [Gimesia chilikensis]